MLAAIVVSAVFWRRLMRKDHRLLLIYLSALAGAFIGAKLLYIAAEGWLHFGKPDMWLQLATGKSIIGALLGGFVAVEISKRMVGYREPTGDWFATVAPLSIAIGRMGCLIHGCCLGAVCRSPAWWTLTDRDGIPRWPAVPAEILFNLIAAAIFLCLRKKQVLPGQHFHLYLIAYGAFRLVHEFLRETPKIAGGLSGYQLASFLLIVLGITGFLIRQQHRAPDDLAPTRA